MSRITSYLDEMDEKREKLLKTARLLNRTSGRGITTVLHGENPEAQLQVATNHYQTTKKLIDDLYPVVSWNTITSDVEEYSEFLILYNLVIHKTFTDPIEMDIPPAIWLTSLADVAGELRRLVLRKLIANETEDAKLYYEYLTLISSSMRGVVYPKNLVANLRRKIDVLRTISEKTDSDMSNALTIQRLDRKLRQLER